MRERDRQRHQFGGVVAGIAKHQALVASADVLAGGVVLINTHSNIWALLTDGHKHAACVSSDAHLGFGVAGAADHIADHLLVVDRAAGGDFTGNHGKASGHERLAGDAAHRVLGKECVEHTVGNLVGQLVRMPHADRLAREQILASCHVSNLARKTNEKPRRPSPPAKCTAYRLSWPVGNRAALCCGRRGQEAEEPLAGGLGCSAA